MCAILRWIKLGLLRLFTTLRLLSYWSPGLLTLFSFPRFFPFSPSRSTPPIVDYEQLSHSFHSLEGFLSALCGIHALLFQLSSNLIPFVVDTYPV